MTLPIQACIGLPPQTNTSLDSSSYVQSLHDELTKIHTTVSSMLKPQYRKGHYDLHSKKRYFTSGDAVWLYDPTKHPGICHKLAPHWKGPYLVINRIADLVYLVKKSQSAPANPTHITLTESI